ncbi:Na+/H+ antiporter NhaC family protein [Halomonas elongata]|uniref:Na+/H+ antiporter NhaC family protein n=2 Tax=Halomonas elongata TaxID=2746 RepID=E1V9D3_HALED|nr:Na+/H+ antiporter NhaC family protein [Halomonas elongata]MBW5801965.1 sodium:proton antiporter [Halomonas elongata]MDL4862670.1 Na+/H+ antiporter NhaC family protein [Halomonas elongata]OBX34702.1 malate-2H(+)/Na(+)-lactate antiporter [Halomonas elongata]RAW06017.1 sodium:proton antiporter [Halomonas elongata]WBF17542.1 sodium:proton antiporter [Halomonas elongata]
METYGAWSLIPTLVVLGMAILTRRTIESLLTGCLVGLLMTDPIHVVSRGSDILLGVLGNDTVTWIILVCGLFGSLIALLVKTGGVLSFGDTMTRRIHSRSQSLLTTWFLGLIIFVDDYLNALTISASMKKITDRFGISREKLAYIVDSTAAPICILVPFSTWAVFFAGLLEENNVTGNGMSLYIDAIPFMFYAWVAAAIVPLVALGWVPNLGPMKAAEARANAGQPMPDGVDDDALEVDENKPRPHLLNFLVPIVTLIFFTWYFDIDILRGVIVALAVTLTLILSQRLLSFHETFDTALEGFKAMIMPLGTLVAGFALKDVNDVLGLTDFVIGTVQPLMTAGLLPAVVFITMAFLAFATGSFWGLFAVAMPIVLPLAESVQADMPLVVGALISASAFGSHACFYGDSTVLSAQGSGCSPMAHALTQLPYVLIAAAIATVVFLTVGYL